MSLKQNTLCVFLPYANSFLIVYFLLNDYILVLFLHDNTEQDLYPIILKKVNGPIKENSETIIITKEILNMETLLSKKSLRKIFKTH